MTVKQRERMAFMDTLGFGVHAMEQCKVCGECGVISPASETVCGSCGRSLPIQTMFQQYEQRHRSCRGCKTIVTAGAVFCPQCGLRLEAWKKEREEGK